MRLTRASQRSAVQKPKTCAVVVNADQSPPIREREPVHLRGPLPGDQEHVPGLNWVFVENQNVIVPDSVNGQLRVPRPKWIDLGTFTAMVFGESVVQHPQFELVCVGSMDLDS